MKTIPRSRFRVARLLRSCTPLRRGVVSLVGAGPGDPGLLTLQAALRIAEAEVVFHDALVSDTILDLCRPGTRLVSVGKRRAAHSVPQARIVAALIDEARAGRCVVRLKGGDPFVFGRGGEEAVALIEAGVPFEIVPGVSAGIAVPALAGIPVTHRGLSGSAAFVTAHDLSDTREGLAHRARLAHLARGAETIVIFMAGAMLREVREVLLTAGLPAGTPAALIESGSLPQERVARGTVDTIPALLEPHAGGPVLVVVGKTVELSRALGIHREDPPATARREARQTRLG
jgi:uroporphyrin-III C-methyltransferase